MNDPESQLDPVLHAAAIGALAALGRGDGELQAHWFTHERAVFFQTEPAPPIFVKVYRQAAQLEHEVAMMRRAAEVGIPVAPLVSFTSGSPAVLITERVVGVPLSSAYSVAAEETGRILRQFHDLGATPPFADGQERWSAFIRDSVERETTTTLARGALTEDVARRIRQNFDRIATVLDARPCVLVLGDCQTDHVLIDPATQRVNAILDFVDAQPGDPLLDIAVLTLFDQALSPMVLRGYGIDWTQADTLLPSYRLLRYLLGANWLVANGAAQYAPEHEDAVNRLVDDLTE